MWIAVGVPSNRDWMKIGTGFPGKSYVEFYGYPSWGDDAS